MNRLTLTLTGFTLMGISVLAVDIPEPATLPYRTLCEMARLRVLDPNTVTNRAVTITVGSTNPEVKPEDIVMFIDAQSGRIPLTILANGQLTLPVTEELLRENPDVVANQPKGSMTLEVVARETAQLPEALTNGKKGLIRYSVLFATELAMRQLAPRLGEVTGTPAAQHAPSIVDFRAKTNLETAAVSVLTAAGEQRLKPVGPGHFTLRFDPKLMEEDPWVRISPDTDWSIKARVQGRQEEAD